MTARPTTQKHRPPTDEAATPGTPVLLLAFPDVRAIPLPPLNIAVGRAYLDEHGWLDEEISKNHFRLSRSGGNLRIEDLGSSNGTVIDGHRIPAQSPAPLRDGNVLRLGRSLFVYREALQGPLEPDPPSGGLVGPWGLRRVREALNGLRGGRTKAVLIHGETGTGKEIVARVAAERLGRSKPFSTVNIAALARNTLEGHLFGWKRGAFSGAEKTDPGLIRAANGGSVFLDEIGEMPFDLQAKLLRVIESGEVQPLGEQAAKADVAFVAATNRDLAEMAAEGTFRQDLLARFRVSIELPPLSERPEDQLPLLQALWRKDRDVAETAPGKMDVEAMELVMLHHHPNNARDLDRLALSLPDDRFELRLKTVQKWLGPEGASRRPAPLTPESLEAALLKHNGNQSEAARELGVDRGAVQRLLKKYPHLRKIGASKK